MKKCKKCKHFDICILRQMTNITDRCPTYEPKEKQKKQY